MDLSAQRTGDAGHDALLDLFDRAVSRDPADRPVSAAAMRTELRALDLTSRPPEPGESITVTDVVRRRRDARVARPRDRGDDRDGRHHPGEPPCSRARPLPTRPGSSRSPPAPPGARRSRGSRCSWWGCSASWPPLAAAPAGPHLPQKGGGGRPLLPYRRCHDRTAPARPLPRHARAARSRLRVRRAGHVRPATVPHRPRAARRLAARRRHRRRAVRHRHHQPARRPLRPAGHPHARPTSRAPTTSTSASRSSTGSRSSTTATPTARTARPRSATPTSGPGSPRSPAAGIIPVILGGDHSITWPAATAVADHHGYGNVGIVHFDAHADTADIIDGNLACHGTPMRRLIESGAVLGRNFVQVGLRGYWPPPDVVRVDARAGHALAPRCTRSGSAGFKAVIGRRRRRGARRRRPPLPLASTSTCSTPASRPAPARPSRAA